jgi:hypothetical protein
VAWLKHGSRREACIAGLLLLLLLLLLLQHGAWPPKRTTHESGSPLRLLESKLLRRLLRHWGRLLLVAILLLHRWRPLVAKLLLLPAVHWLTACPWVLAAHLQAVL